MGLVHPMSREIAEISYLWRTSHRIDGAALHGMIGPLLETPVEETSGWRSANCSCDGSLVV